MKHFFKHMNRGIVLGVVLLIGLVVFIWQDEASFQKETPSIEHTITSYLDAMCKINTFDENFQKIGATMTKAQQTDKLQEMTKMVDQYWAESNTKTSFSKSELLKQLEEMVTKNSKGNGYIQKFTIKQNGTPTVKKTGPGSASAEVSYDIVVEYAGSPLYLLGEHVDVVTNFAGMGNGDSSKPATEAKRKRYTINVHDNTELERIGGTWKIVSITGGYSGSGQPADIE